MKSPGHRIPLAVGLHRLVKIVPEYESTKVGAHVNLPNTSVRYVPLSPFCGGGRRNVKELANPYCIVFSTLRASTQ